MKRTPITAVLILVAASLAACTTTSPDVVRYGEAQRLSQVQDATVLSVRPVVVDGSQSGLGATAGAVIGGVAGSTRSHGAEQALISVAGAVIGGLVGNAVERAGTSEQAVEILLQMRNGDRRSIVQARSAEVFNPGDAVILVTTGGRTRVTRAPVVAPVPGVPAAPGAPLPPGTPVPPAATVPDIRG